MANEVFISVLNLQLTKRGNDLISFVLIHSCTKYLWYLSRMDLCLWFLLHVLVSFFFLSDNLVPEEKVEVVKGVSLTTDGNDAIFYIPTEDLDTYLSSKVSLDYWIGILIAFKISHNYWLRIWAISLYSMRIHFYIFCLGHVFHWIKFVLKFRKMQLM